MYNIFKINMSIKVEYLLIKFYFDFFNLEKHLTTRLLKYNLKNLIDK